MNVQPNILFTVHERAPFVGDHVDDDNLLQKGRPLIMRFQQSLGWERLVIAKGRDALYAAEIQE